MILHIPHSKIDPFNKIDPKNIKESLELLTDQFTDDLFNHIGYTKIIFPVSRFLCDVERFKYDDKMEKVGKGVIYTRDVFNKPYTPIIPKEFVYELYDEHHLLLTNAINKYKGYFKNIVIVDCHSFSEELIDYKCADVCIGIDDFHTNPKLIDLVKTSFLKYGYSVDINKPFNGSIVPDIFYKKDNNVQSIMIELNKKIYLDDNYEKNNNYENVKNIINEILENILEYQINEV